MRAFTIAFFFGCVGTSQASRVARTQHVPAAQSSEASRGPLAAMAAMLMAHNPAAAFSTSAAVGRARAVNSVSSGGALQMSTKPVANTMISKAGEDALTKLTLTSASGATAEVYTLGATVTSFKAPSELLFVRPDAKFDGSKPISGGLPFCWPQFGPGEIQQHGFARNCEWELAKVEGASVTFVLKSNEYTKKMWGNDFKNTYTVTVGEDNKLHTVFTVENTGSEELTFTGALHSYFNVGDIDQTAVQGAFKGATIFDRMLDPPARTTEDRAEVTVAEETDRCYEGVNGVVKIADKANSRTIVIDNKAGYVDTCVWNPWNEGMGSKTFICVESGNVKDAVKVAPGSVWKGEMTLSLE